MDTISFIFRLGVLFAIFSFIWFLINAGITLLRGTKEKSTAEVYILKFIRYFFMVDVTLLFCIESSDGNLDFGRLITAGLILLMYFLSKFQNAEMKSKFTNIRSSLLSQLPFKTHFNKNAEILIISICTLFFGLLVLYPQYAQNPISEWFYETIIGFEKAPLLGFIFKIVGFFFVISIFTKLSRGLTLLLSGGAIKEELGNDDFNDKNKDDNHFDDYEEIK
ncbi:MAG: hypothetical protein ACPGU5_06995 [Lishizhenia sp.]